MRCLQDTLWQISVQRMEAVFLVCLQGLPSRGGWDGREGRFSILLCASYIPAKLRHMVLKAYPSFYCLAGLCLTSIYSSGLRGAAQRYEDKKKVFLGGYRGSALRVQGDGAGQKGDVRRPRGGNRNFSTLSLPSHISWNSSAGQVSAYKYLLPSDLLSPTFSPLELFIPLRIIEKV